ncbi:D-2-hydroxyacid dehydrogenase [Rhodovibrionaceae bacterium A322]
MSSVSNTTRRPDEETRVLVMHDDCDAYFGELTARFPDLLIERAQEGEGLDALLARVRPTVVFGVRCKSHPLEMRLGMISHPQVRWYQNAGVGVEPLLPHVHDQLILTNGVGVLSGHLAETVIGALTALNFKLPTYLEQQKEKRWLAHPFTGLAGKTLVLVGLGGVGQAVALRAKALGLKVIGVNSSGRPVAGVDQVYPVSQLAEAVRQADFLSLHTSSTPQTRHLISAEILDLLKPEAYFLNTARGAVVDEGALIDRLQRRTFAGAYLDVFEVEPLPQDSPLWQLDNVIITPHCADSVSNWQGEMAMFFAENLERWLACEPLKNIVDVARGY